MFKGLPERLKKEIITLAPTIERNVIAVESPLTASWIGGSILTSLAIFPSMLIPHLEYNDAGPGIVRHCF
jgi:actin-related protein